MMHGYTWDHMGAWGWTGMVMMLLFWFVFAAFVIWALTSWRGGQRSTTPTGPTGDSAMAILRERLARGEIAADEFERVRQTLDNGPR